jgi:hypothetical protein
VNTSRTKGKTWNIGESWTPTHYLLQALPGRDNRQQSDGRSWSKSETEGESRGWNEGRSEGSSRGSSRSRTDGTSETYGSSQSETEGATYGTSRSETVGTTRGTSQSRTSGAGETIHKRALVTPDEIGQLFARIDDRAHQAYPGLALVVISGARPGALRRVNYYEDLQFAGLFDPHPDHPFVKIEPPKLSLRIENNLDLLVNLEKLRLLTGNPGQLHQHGKAGQRVEKGERVATLRHPAFEGGGLDIVSPADGTIAYWSNDADAPPWQVWYYVEHEGGIDRMYGYTDWEIDSAISNLVRDRQKAAADALLWGTVGAGLLAVATIGLIVAGGGAAGLAIVTGLAAAGLLAWGLSRKNWKERYDQESLAYLSKLNGQEIKDESGLRERWSAQFD